MPTTSNFGWTTPADTDLVKDGAAAIRTLGNGIDTSFLDLKGGTTDQVLAKNSNTDLDFKWVAADDADAIQKSLIDAEGDLIVGDAADAVQRLAIGSNGNVLTVDTAVDGKIKWAAPAGAGTWSSVASGSLSGSELSVTGLSGKKFIVMLKSASHNGAPGYNSFRLRLNADTGSNYVENGGNGNTAQIETDSINGNKTLNIIWLIDAADATTTPKFIQIASSGDKNPDGSDPYFTRAGGLYLGTSAVSQISVSLSTQSYDGGTYEIWSLS